MPGRYHSAGAAAAALLVGAGAVAAEKSFSLIITGAAGARYTGQCTLTTAGGEQTLGLSGVVPRCEELSAEAVACRIASAGSITVEIAHDGSRSRSTITGAPRTWPRAEGAAGRSRLVTPAPP
jgi:hypothetical protein